MGTLFGFGDYEDTAPVNYPIHNNSLIGIQTPLASQLPEMHAGQGVCRISKREYIRDIIMTNAVTNSVLPLNPVDPLTFPWLSGIASKFEQYKFLGLAFGFRSLTANALGATGNPSMGSVTFATSYDVLDQVMLTKTEANNALYATSCKPSESMLHPVECDPELTPNQPLYTGINEKPAAAQYSVTHARDLRLNYLGFLQVMVQGGPAGIVYNPGELWVTYDVILMKPMIQTGTGPPVESISALALADRDRPVDRSAIEPNPDSFVNVPTTGSRVAPIYQR